MKKALEILNSQFDTMVATIQKVVSFNTEKQPPEGDAPFGREVADCLHYVLNLAESFGLATYNCDNYAGHADLAGSGKEILGVLGHLDVVPAKPEEWQYPPFDGEIHDGKMYARGTMDDKGPMIACLFAVKALKDAGFVPNKTVRLIFGCDEESGMECVKHYFQKMPKPEIAFSPDGDFPVINREKGIYHCDIVCGKLPQGVTLAAGERANVVPSLCVATTTRPVELAENVSAREENGKTILTGVGKAAHGSTPDEGINASHAIIFALAKAYPESDALQFLTRLCDTTGKNWGVALHDQASGNLTCNLGILRTADDGTLTVTMDIRFPVSYNCEKMSALIRKSTPAQFEICKAHCSEPLFVPSDGQLVTTLMKIYNEKLGVDAQPLAIGGGTYSKCLPNCVSFGPLFPGEEQTIHMPNECIILDNLRLMAELYLEAIYELSK